MISHRMPELNGAATIATVLRDGRSVAEVPLPATPRERARAADGRARAGRPLPQARDRARRDGARGRRTAVAGRPAQADHAVRPPRRDRRRRRARRLGQGRARSRAGRGDPERGQRPRARPARRPLAAALGARERDRLRARRPQAGRVAADAQRGRELLRRVDGPAHARGRARHARRAPARARGDRALRHRDRVAAEPHHGALGWQPAEGRPRARARPRPGGARALGADARDRRRRQERDLPADAGARGAGRRDRRHLVRAARAARDRRSHPRLLPRRAAGRVRRRRARQRRRWPRWRSPARPGGALRRTARLCAAVAGPPRRRPRRAGRRLRLPDGHRGGVPDLGQRHEHREVEQRRVRAGDRCDVRDHLRGPRPLGRVGGDRSWDDPRAHDGRGLEHRPGVDGDGALRRPARSAERGA